MDCHGRNAALTSIFISEKSLRFAHRIAAAKTMGAIGSITK